ncbi:MAG: rhodanese-related sulfurtransferase [Simkania sp.]|nr:rhodanese-related sulfurtransferase [Simkania sp.]
MEESKKIYVLAFYYFTAIEDPDLEVSRHQEFLSSRDVRARTYISHQGINGQMSASPEAAEEYMAWLKSDPRFAGVEFKIHYYFEHVFPRCTIKKRQQIVALDVEVDAKDGGEHVSPMHWKEMLKNRDENTILLDVRNEYEWKLGRFEGAELPKLETFRQFPQYAKELKKERDPQKTKVMMYCTGGIRCELYSALLKKEGFEQVYQLHGGVIQYGLEEGCDGWLGKLFVFDDRLAVSISDEEEAPTIGSCYHCRVEAEAYYNCSNMDCNELFLCCPVCAESWQGCCCETCKTAPRVRAFVASERPKPFGRWYRYLQQKNLEPV